MLIPSHRHRPRDLALWAELEEADRIHGESPAVSLRVETSLSVLRAFAARGPCHAGISCGKDSMVLAGLCLRLQAQGVTIPLIHIRAVPLSNPDNSSVLDAWSILFPGSPVKVLTADYSGIDPSLSIDAIEAAKDRIFFRVCDAIERGSRRILGVRASESRVRKLRMLTYGHSTDKACAPLGWWSLADVFGYLAANGLPVHPAYAMLGGGRWRREDLRVDELGGQLGRGRGRAEWEREYYGDVLRRLEFAR